jgi:predicted RNase H-like HicB family nuclease
MKEGRYTVLSAPAEEGGFVATCPAMPGLVAEGDTLSEARLMAKDVIQAYIESLRKDGLPPPDDVKCARTLSFFEPAPAERKIERSGRPHRKEPSNCLERRLNSIFSLKDEPGGVG